MIDVDVLEAVLAEGKRLGGSFVEVFFEDRESKQITLDDSKIEGVSSGRSRGAGVRVMHGEATGFAHTADLSRAGLVAAVSAAAAAGSAPPGTAPVALDRSRVVDSAADEASEDRIPTATKVEYLLRANEAARAAREEDQRSDEQVVQVGVSLAELRRRIQIANSDGLLATDDVRRTRFAVQCVAKGDAGLQTGMEAPGRTVGFEYFEEFPPEATAEEASRRALRMLRARPAPSGKLPVVMARGAGGVLFHEACGHGLEADIIERGASVFKDRIGQQVAASGVTLIDDATEAREWGTFAIDDEGTPARRNTLIENGVLTDYMWDHIRSRRAGRQRSGNGRRETYECLPMVRMTNTYVLNGDSSADDIISSTEHGIYCVQLGGGQVDTATGDFVFGITEAYMIEQGRLTYPIKAAQLIGNGPAVLQRIDAVGNDFATWAGTCGKDGQGVPVSSGQPTLRVSELTIGGTAS
ncbi:MAG: TldD/PmbA family protein [Acidimicrobiia bacterium]